MRNWYIEVIGPSGSGKTVHLAALSRDSRFTITARHHIRQHASILLRSIWTWLFLQVRFFFLDARLIMFKRICVYHAALKTTASGEKVYMRNRYQHVAHLVDEGMLHVLLMHRFVSLREQAAWSYFAKSQICRLAEEKNVLVFLLSVDPVLRRKRLERRNKVEWQRLRVATNIEELPYGPLGVDFFISLNCDRGGIMKLEVVDNIFEDGVDINVSYIKETILEHLSSSGAHEFNNAPSAQS